MNTPVCSLPKLSPPNNHGGSGWGGDAGNEDPVESVRKFRQLLIRSPYITHLAFAPVIKACSRSSSFSAGAQIHAQSVKRGLSSDVFVQTSLLSMYSSWGQFGDSSKLFDKMPERNVVSWTAMIDACLRSDLPSMAVSLFQRMWVSGMGPDEFTVVSFLSACSDLGALNMGRCAHSYVHRLGMKLNIFMGTALVDMYSKCGCIDDAIAVFDLMPEKSTQSWNAMLHGLALHGRGMEAMELFGAMEKDALVRPNELTFLSLLCGCSHSGLVREGLHYLNLMQTTFGISPRIKHYGCVVDLLGRAGLLDKAYRMIEEMPMEPNIVVLGSLLCSCWNWSNLPIAEKVGARIKAMEIDRGDGETSDYVVLSNFYKQEGLVEKMCEARKSVGRKPQGMSWIEIGCQVHEFAVGETKHPLWRKIMNKLDEVMEKVKKGYTKESYFHSERIALALGLLSTSNPTPIRIAKNLRICESCHDTMKFVSGAYSRYIVVRDCSRFHHFKDGSCSCKDYW